MSEVPAYQLRRQTGRGEHWLLGKQVLNACSLDSRISLQETQAQHEDIYLNTYDPVPTLPGVGHLGLLSCLSTTDQPELAQHCPA